MNFQWKKKHNCAYVQDKIELRVYAYVQEGYDQARPFYNAKKTFASGRII